MIIKPYSAFAEESFVAADFPCVKHFFPCDEVAGTNTLSDVVGDVVINFAGLTRTSDGFGVESTTTGGQTTSGNWSVPGSKLWVLFTVASFTNILTNAFVFGIDGAKDSIYMTGNTPSVDVNTAGTSAAGTAFTAPAALAIGGRALAVQAYNNAAGLRTYQFDAAGTFATLLGTTGTDAAAATVAYTEGHGLETGLGGFLLAGANSALYGVVWMEFTSLPADLLAGLAWMTKEWSIGNKAIYPAWKDLT